MCSPPSAVLCCVGCAYAQVTVSHLSLLCLEQMALWRHRGDEQPVAGNVSCGLTPGQLQRAVTQLTHLQIFRSYYPLHHYSRKNSTSYCTFQSVCVTTHVFACRLWVWC